MNEATALPGLPASRDNDLVADAAMYRVMIENTIDIIVRYDLSRRRTYISPSCREVLGYEPAEMLASDPAEVIHPDDYPSIHPIFTSLSPSRPRLQLAFRMRRKDGNYVWIEAHYRCLPDNLGYLAMLRDVTPRKRAEIQLTEANARLAALNRTLHAWAKQDGLTGLVNRRHFDALLDREFRRAARRQLPLSVLLLDADRFKTYNDHYGHLAGDECLRRISRTMKEMLRRPGDEAARFGGEEFAVLLPATDNDGARHMAERIRNAVMSMSIEHRGSDTGTVTVSIGASSMVPRIPANTPIDLVDAADRALYRAKSGGRNRVEILPAVDAALA